METVTRNACKLCTPMGAAIAFKGVKSCIPILHGSQGCSTYIRRYLISHYKEPVDIASSNFSIDSTIFGGQRNFEAAILNLMSQYKPEVIGIATTCLSETIGEDIQLLLNEFKIKHAEMELPKFILTSTPGYQGTHTDGFHETVSAIVQTFAKSGNPESHINIFPGFISPADIRYLKEIFSDFCLDNILVPDFSETFDNPVWDDYYLIPPGGTSTERLEKTGTAQASIEFGAVLNSANKAGHIKEFSPIETAGKYLQSNFNIPLYSTYIPIGIKLTDKFFDIIKNITGGKIPVKHEVERGRLIDSYVDGHKYTFGKRAIVYGDEDFVISMCSFLTEIGIDVVLAATGGESGKMKDFIRKTSEKPDGIEVIQGVDFEDIADKAEILKPDLVVGNSKGYYITRKLGIPLVRVGFPIHDRVGGQRLLHIGYRGAQQMFDTIVNALIEQTQNTSKVGYKYM